MKKSIKLFFDGKNDTQNSGFAVVKKAPSPGKKLKKIKNSSSLFAQVRPTKWCAETF